MKNYSVLIAATMILGGCSTDHKESTEDHLIDFPPTVKNLPSAALEALKGAEVNPAVTLVIGEDKKLYIFRRVDEDGPTTVETKFPFETKVRSIDSSTIMFHTGSECVTYNWGGSSYTTCWR